MIPTGASLVVALDANVLFGYPLCDTLLYAVEAGLYRPAWSETTWEEVARNLKDPGRKRPHTDEGVQRLMNAVRRSFPDAFVDGYQPLESDMPVNAKDRHVAAMAVHAQAQILVIYNLKHFPSDGLALYGIDVQHPDAFLHDLYLRTPLSMVDVVRAQAASLTNPAKTPRDILDDLNKVRIRRFAHAIRARLS